MDDHTIHVGLASNEEQYYSYTISYIEVETLVGNFTGFDIHTCYTLILTAGG